MRTFEQKIEGHEKPFRVAVFESAQSIVTDVKDDKSKGYAGLKERMEQDDEWTFGKWGGQSVTDIIEGRCQINPPSQEKFKAVRGGKSLKRRKKYNDFEGDVSVEKVLGGSITPFMKKHRVSTKGKTIDVVVSLSVHCGIRSKEISEYAECVAERVFKLVAQGRNVNVYYCSGATSQYTNGDGGFQFIKLKSGRNKVDPQRIMSIAYPAMFRYFSFMGEHACSKGEGGDVSGNRGRPLNNIESLKKLVECVSPYRKILYDMEAWQKNDKQLKSVNEWDVENI